MTTQKGRSACLSRAASNVVNPMLHTGEEEAPPQHKCCLHGILRKKGRSLFANWKTRYIELNQYTGIGDDILWPCCSTLNCPTPRRSSSMALLSICSLTEDVEVEDENAKAVGFFEYYESQNKKVKKGRYNLLRSSECITLEQYITGPNCKSKKFVPHCFVVRTGWLAVWNYCVSHIRRSCVTVLLAYFTILRQPTLHHHHYHYLRHQHHQLHYHHYHYHWYQHIISFKIIASIYLTSTPYLRHHDHDIHANKKKCKRGGKIIDKRWIFFGRRLNTGAFELDGGAGFCHANSECFKLCIFVYVCCYFAWETKMLVRIYKYLNSCRL